MVRNTLAFVAASLVAPSLAAQLADWQQRSIYQVITDRFAKATDDGGPCDSGARQYCGGTWQGIINHLDYIQGMGFDAVWISPVTANLEGNTTYGEAYHGYWPVNFNALNPHYGAPSDLTALSDALHKRGMYLMVDIVLNHVAATGVPTSFSQFTPYNNAAQYHPQCWITDYNNQTQVEQCWVGDENVALVDLNTEDPTVISGHQAFIKELVTTHKIDGLRLDTVKHIRKDFYPDFVKAAGVYATGEVLDILANYTGDYSNYMDTVMNYPQFFYLQQAFLNPQGNMANLVQNVKDTQQYFKNGAMSTTSFSENHDNPRLPSIISDPVLVRSCIAWTFVNDGTPILYYGQEASYNGGNDPFNREALWFTSYSKDVSNYQFVANLNAARKLALGDKSSKFVSTAATVAASTANNIALSKYPLLTVLTNAGNSSTAAWTVPNSGYKSGVTLVDVVSSSCDTVTVGSDGSVPVTFAAGAPKVYLPATVLSKTGVCGSKASAEGNTSGGGSSGSAGFKNSAVSGVAALVATAVLAFVAL